MESLFTGKEKVSQPYTDSIRIAIIHTDEQVVQDAVSEKSAYVKLFTGILPEVVLNRFFSDQEIQKKLGIDSLIWTRTLEMRRGEGDFIFNTPERQFRMDVKSRLLHNKIDDGWVMIDDKIARYGDSCHISGYMFTAIDIYRGFIYLIGYMMNHEFSDARKTKAIEYVEAGTVFGKKQTRARFPFWKLPYSNLTKFSEPIKYGDFEQAKKVVEWTGIREKIYADDTRAAG